eukprot:1148986-Pelagomonas_calceolata.AAC.3
MPNDGAGVEGLGTHPHLIILIHRLPVDRGTCRGLQVRGRHDLPPRHEDSCRQLPHDSRVGPLPTAAADAARQGGQQAVQQASCVASKIH